MLENHIPDNFSPKEHFDKNDFALFFGSSFYLLKKLKSDPFIDVVITSPPFSFPFMSKKESINKHVELIKLLLFYMKDGANLIYQIGSIKNEVNDLDSTLTQEILNKCDNIILNKKIILLTGSETDGNSKAHNLYAGFNFKGGYQTILWLSKGKSSYVNEKAFNMIDVFDFSSDYENLKKMNIYTSQFPQSLYKLFIELFSKKGDIIFDPFACQHNILHVGLPMGRKVFTSEKSRSFVKSAVTSLYLDQQISYLKKRDCFLFSDKT